MPHSPSLTTENVPTDATLQVEQSIVPHHPYVSHFGHPPVPSYNSLVAGGSSPDMLPPGNNSNGNPNGVRGADLDSSFISDFASNRPHGSSPYILPSAFAPTQRQFPASPMVNSPSGTHNSTRGIAIPDISIFSPPAIAQTRSDRLLSNASSLASPRLVQQHSRLPPNTVARKAPRKSTVALPRPVQNVPKVSESSVKHAKPRRKNSGDTPSRTLASPASVRISPKDVTPRLMQSGCATALSADSKAVASNSDHHTKQSSVSQTRRLTLDDYDKVISSLPSTEIPKKAEEDTQAPPIVTQKQARASKQVEHPQTRYEYEVPPELKGVRRALGRDDWTEYLMLAEKYALKEISDKDFEAGGRCMFYVTDAKTRKKIQGMVMNLMVGVKMKNQTVSS